MEGINSCVVTEAVTNEQLMACMQIIAENQQDQLVEAIIGFVVLVVMVLISR